MGFLEDDFRFPMALGVGWRWLIRGQRQISVSRRSCESHRVRLWDVLLLSYRAVITYATPQCASDARRTPCFRYRYRCIGALAPRLQRQVWVNAIPVDALETGLWVRSSASADRPGEPTPHSAIRYLLICTICSKAPFPVARGMT